MDSDALIARWLERKAHNEGRADATVERYRYCLTQLAQYLHEQHGKDVLQATASDLELFCGYYLHTMKRRPSARRVYVSAIRGFYKWLYEQRILSENTAASLPLPRCATPLPRAMQLGSIEKILMQPDLSTFAGVRDLAMLFVLTGTGCRVSGLTALNESDVIVTKQPQKLERTIIQFREKGGKERLVPVPLDTQVMLRAYLGHQELATIDRVLPDGDKVLFVNLRVSGVKKWDHYGEARRISRRSINDIILKYGEMAGVPKSICHPHALRHLYGAELAESDVDLIQRMALLGHAVPESTAIYTRLATRKLQKTVDEANPLSKIRTVATDVVKALRLSSINADD